MKLTAFVLLTIGLIAFAADHTAPSLNDGEPHGDPRYLLEPGWTQLLNGKDLTGWHAADNKPLLWFTTRGVRWDKENPKALHAMPAPGGTMLNSATGKTAHLVSDQKYGDVELYVEFMIPQGSNSGVYVQGLYEIQISDSYGKREPNSHDAGGVYQRWINEKGVGGTAPLVNAARPAGQWQSYEIWFRAPRFDSAGKKTENARFLRVLHNSVLVQQDVESEGPTRACLNIPEAPLNPIMLQGDHGAVAYRNLYIRPLRPLTK